MRSELHYFDSAVHASRANHSRLTSVTYASGYVLTYTYASGLNSDISRLTSLSDANGTLESYDHLGFGTVVRRGHSQPNVDLSFIKRSGESNTDAGDQYTGLDRFGRVVDQRWVLTSNGTAKDRLQYTYDAMGNRTLRANVVNSAFDETYTYDALNQLLSFARGSDAQSYDFDAVGNWESVTTNGTTQTRGHNKQNEITSVSGATTPTFDANGNMTGDETGRQFVYDAWNRMVEVKNSGGTSLKTFEFDGLNRRISETASGTTRDLYYSAQWQVLEERVSGATERRYVWSPVYVDALVLRDRDTDANGSLDERLYVVQDANFNVVALLDTSGNVVERFTYTPFGVQTVYDANWTVRGGGSAYSFTHGFQGMAFDSVAGLNPQRYRWYSPTLGRWVTMDPIRYEAGDVNLYGFVYNGVLTRTDPLGLQPPKDARNLVPGDPPSKNPPLPKELVGTWLQIENLLKQTGRFGDDPVGAVVNALPKFNLFKGDKTRCVWVEIDMSVMSIYALPLDLMTGLIGPDLHSPRSKVLLALASNEALKSYFPRSYQDCECAAPKTCKNWRMVDSTNYFIKFGDGKVSLNAAKVPGKNPVDTAISIENTPINVMLNGLTRVILGAELVKAPNLNYDINGIIIVKMTKYSGECS